MNAQLEELLSILQQETELHEKLLQLLQEEAEGFGNLSASKMLKLQSLKLQQTRLIAKLETRRIAVVDGMSGDFEETSDSLTLSSIIRQVSQEWATPLQAYFDRLKELIAEKRWLYCFYVKNIVLVFFFDLVHCFLFRTNNENRKRISSRKIWEVQFDRA